EDGIRDKLVTGVQTCALPIFWLDASGELAFAIDGKKRAIPTVASDSGHCLWMGILDGERGRAAGRRLMQPDMFTGWGLRVLSDRSEERRVGEEWGRREGWRGW